MTQRNETPPDTPVSAIQQRLLEEALELFTTKGYAATSVREIVEAAGVSKPVLYYWFGSKEGLYLALMNDLMAACTELIAQFSAFHGGTRERLVHFCAGMFDGFVAHLAVVRLVYAIYYGPPQGAPPFPHEELFDRMVQEIGAIVHDGIASGDLRPLDESDATWAVVAPLNTIMQEQLCHTPPRVDRDALVRILNLSIDGLSQRR